jgi:hypothetical protein
LVALATDLWRLFSEMEPGVDAVSPIIDPRKKMQWLIDELMKLSATARKKPGLIG